MRPERRTEGWNKQKMENKNNQTTTDQPAEGEQEWQKIAADYVAEHGTVSADEVRRLNTEVGLTAESFIAAQQDQSPPVERGAITPESREAHFRQWVDSMGDDWNPTSFSAAKHGYHAGYAQGHADSLNASDRLNFRPMGDNHHNAAMCPYCGDPVRHLKGLVEELCGAIAEYSTFNKDVMVNAACSEDGMRVAVRLQKAHLAGKAALDKAGKG